MAPGFVEVPSTATGNSSPGPDPGRDHDHGRRQPARAARRRDPADQDRRAGLRVPGRRRHAIVALVAAATWYDFSPQYPINQGLDLRAEEKRVNIIATANGRSLAR